MYGTGHASTSVSAAVGMVEARRLTAESRSGWAGGRRKCRWAEGRVVAVIGDGALTGGMAYEALESRGSPEDARAGGAERQRHVHREERRRDEQLPV